VTQTRIPHLPQILQGPLSARPSAAQTPDWVWYFAWDDNGGAFYRPTSTGWVKATPSVLASPWQDPQLAKGWSPIPDAPLRFRRNGDQVEMGGGVMGSAGDLPSEVATLPAMYRPSAEIRVPVVDTQSLAYITLTTAGIITLHAPPSAALGDSHRIYFDSVRFALR
jgi:hypothetical protein